MLAGNGFNMGRAGWTYVIAGLRSNDRHKRLLWIDLASLILHLVVFVGVPAMFVSLPVALGPMSLRITLMGYALFAVLGPGHLPAEAARLSADQKDADYLLRQTATTINFNTRLVGRFVCSGLEYQIEHHLFPNISARALSEGGADRERLLPRPRASVPFVLRGRWRCGNAGQCCGRRGSSKPISNRSRCRGRKGHYAAVELHADCRNLTKFP